MRGYFICADKGETCVYATVNGTCSVTACVLEPRLKTNADRINEMTIEEKAAFLYKVAYAGEQPWSKPFYEKFCANCPTERVTVVETGSELDLHECDFKDGLCPHGHDISWWLQQPAEEGADGKP